MSRTIKRLVAHAKANYHHNMKTRPIKINIWERTVYHPHYGEPKKHSLANIFSACVKSNMQGRDNFTIGF